MSRCISSRDRCWRLQGQPLGVVTAIAGQTYFTVELTGEAGHAGTVPMLLRRDALAGAAEIVCSSRALRTDTRTALWPRSAISRHPQCHQRHSRRVVFILDLRSTSDATRERDRRPL